MREGVIGQVQERNMTVYLRLPRWFMSSLVLGMVALLRAGVKVCFDEFIIE